MASASGRGSTPPLCGPWGTYLALTPSSCRPVEEIAWNPSTFWGLEPVIMLREHEREDHGLLGEQILSLAPLGLGGVTVKLNGLVHDGLAAC